VTKISYLLALKLAVVRRSFEQRLYSLIVERIVLPLTPNASAVRFRDIYLTADPGVNTLRRGITPVLRGYPETVPQTVFVVNN